MACIFLSLLTLTHLKCLNLQFCYFIDVCLDFLIIEKLKLMIDMAGYQAPHGGTIPPHILVTNLRPDIFIVDENARIAIVFELTCPWDNNIERSHNYKEEKYAPLVADLTNAFSVFHFSVEVSVRGQISKSNRARLKSFLYRSCRDARPLTKSLTKIVSKAALLSSFSLFNARKEPSWINPTPLVVKWSYILIIYLIRYNVVHYVASVGFGKQFINLVFVCFFLSHGCAGQWSVLSSVLLLLHSFNSIICLSLARFPHRFIFCSLNIKLIITQ